MKHNLYFYSRLKQVPPRLRYALISRASFWLGGLLSGLSLFVEDKRRRGELAMYVLPRGLESAWGVMRRRGWVPIVPGGENLLCAVGMSMVMVSLEIFSDSSAVLIELRVAGHLSGESSDKCDARVLIYFYRQALINCPDSSDVYCTSLLDPINLFSFIQIQCLLYSPLYQGQHGHGRLP